ncbi:redoxin domain-containing protein [Fluviicola sp. SGL-29]|nr:redoxin domain-containing protein [Fluviicola sp. SGL-29]
MKSTFLTILLAVAGAFAFGQHATLKISDTAPLADRKMEATDGKQLSLNDVKGENGTLVIFSCNTCPFVVGMKDGGFPGWEKDYNALHKLAAEKGFGVILVNSNEAKRSGEESEDTMGAMKERAKANGYTIPYVVDKESTLADAFGAKTTPHVFLFDKEMKLIYTGSIDNTWDPKRKEDIPYLINALSQFDSKIKVAESEPRGCSIKRVAKS